MPVALEFFADAAELAAHVGAEVDVAADAVAGVYQNQVLAFGADVLPFARRQFGELSERYLSALHARRCS